MVPCPVLGKLMVKISLARELILGPSIVFGRPTHFRASCRFLRSRGRRALLRQSPGVVALRLLHPLLRPAHVGHLLRSLACRGQFPASLCQPQAL